MCLADWHEYKNYKHAVKREKEKRGDRQEVIEFEKKEILNFKKEREREIYQILMEKSEKIQWEISCNL